MGLRLGLVVALMALSITSAAHAVEWKAPGPNIAQGKSYRLDKDPKKQRGNYKACVGNDDKDLTDGKLAGGRTMWVDKACVGWQGGPHSMTFDLGEVKPISGVGYHTQAGPNSGAGWPPAILILVSDDGKSFRYAGELIGLSSKFGAVGDHGKHWFRTDELKTHGRYVQLVVQSSIFVFSDEVEIYEGRPDYLKEQLTGDVIEEDGTQYLQDRKLPFAISARVATDAARAMALVEKLQTTEAARKQALAQLEKLRVEALKPEFVEYDEDYRSIVPLNPLHAQVFAALSAAYRAAGYPEYTLWNAERWARQSPFDVPPASAQAKPPTATLDVHTLHNDRRGEVLNLGNFSDDAQTALITFSGLPGGAKPAYIRVRQAEYLAMQSRLWDADPLPLAEETADGWKVTLPAGVSRQLWFDFCPDTKTCPAGKHKGEVSIRIEGGKRLSVPITLTVGNYRLPKFQDRALAVAVWDYTDMDGWGSFLGFNKKAGEVRPNLAAAIRHMQESGVNAPWGRSDWRARGTFPRPKPSGKGAKIQIAPGMPLHELVGIPYDTDGQGVFDDSGKLRVELDFTAFDAWVKAWPDAKYYMIYVNMDWGYAGAKGKDWTQKGFSAADQKNNDEVQHRLQVVMKNWADHMRQIGVDPSRIVLCMVDEPMYSSQARMTNFWAKPIKEAVPEFKVYIDPRVKPDYFTNPDVLEMYELSDIITPGVDYSYQWLGQAAVDFYEGWRQKGKTLGFYSCASNPSEADSTRYYRLQQWYCWDISKGAEESYGGFWNYSDFRGVLPWNPLPGGSRDRTWCVAYLDSKSATDGKHWLAIFEGANDYEYLRILKNRIAELEKSGDKRDKVAAAKKVLEEVPRRVIDEGRRTGDNKICDSGRLEILAALESLAP